MPKTKTPDDGGRPSLHLQTGATAVRVALPCLIALAWTAGASAQWAPVPDPKYRGMRRATWCWTRRRRGLPPEPRISPGSGCGRAAGRRRRTPEAAAAVSSSLNRQPVPIDPNGPPIAAFFEAGQNIEGGLPYTPWAKELRDQRFALRARDNPDAQCLPMGFLQFHQQPQPRMIIQTEKLILIEYEANYGLRHIYLDGRELPPQGEPQPFWYGYSVGHWDGDDLVVETNNLRGADEDSPYDGWMDVNGSPYTRQAKFTERFRRPTFGHLQIDLTIEDPKAYTKPWTVRIDQRLLPDQELIEFVCNENQQFGSRIKLDQEPASEPSSTRE